MGANGRSTVAPGGSCGIVGGFRQASTGGDGLRYFMRRCSPSSGGGGDSLAGSNMCEAAVVGWEFASVSRLPIDFPLSSEVERMGALSRVLAQESSAAIS